MYQALYRKWRPKTFADVIGQSHITQTLQKQVVEGRTSHAYLFTGTRGTGKTTCAKILAKAVNCEHPVDGNPCCQCPSCLGIESGSFLDVLELDAASNNGVDQVRALRDEAIYSPANVKKRVYIVDEVHMLSISAFNALLKILEEPPEHLMFILATTELHKVPPTILSRCQRFSFRRIQPQEIAGRLLYVAGQEGIDLTADGAELLSRMSDGALRDGLSLLDQCAANGGKVDSQSILDTLGLAGNLQTAHLMELILARDVPAALALLDQLYSGGKDVGAILNELSALTRDLLLCKTAPEGAAALLSGSFDQGTLQRLGKGQSMQRFLYLASTLQKTSAELYYSTNRRTDAELCLLRLCDEGLTGDLTALNARMQRLEERMNVLPAAIRQQAAAPAAPAPAPAAAEKPAAPKAAPKAEDLPPWEEPPMPKEAPAPPEETSSPEPIPQPAEIRFAGPAMPASAPVAAPAAAAAPVTGDIWPELKESSKGQLPPMYRAFLDMCRGTVANGVITVYAPDDITKGRLNNDRVIHALQEQGRTLTGAELQVRLMVGSAPQTSSVEERRKNLIQLGSQFDSIQIK